MNEESMSWTLSLLLRVPVGIVLLWAAAGKLADPVEFVNTVKLHEWVPRPLASMTGWLLPWFELLLGYLLVAGIATSQVSLVAGVVLGLSGAVGLVTLLRGGIVPCGCFGSLSTERISWLTIVRAAALSTVLMITAVLYRGSSQEVSADAAAAAAGVVMIVLALSEWLLIQRVERRSVIGERSVETGIGGRT